MPVLKSLKPLCQAQGACELCFVFLLLFLFLSNVNKNISTCKIQYTRHNPAIGREERKKQKEKKNRNAKKNTVFTRITNYSNCTKISSKQGLLGWCE